MLYSEELQGLSPWRGGERERGGEGEGGGGGEREGGGGEREGGRERGRYRGKKEGCPVLLSNVPKNFFLLLIIHSQSFPYDI